MDIPSYYLDIPLFCSSSAVQGRCRFYCVIYKVACVICKVAQYIVSYIKLHKSLPDKKGH